MRVAIVLLALGSVAHADTVVGRVTASRARSAGDVIVTESDVRRADGSIATVIQLGGSVDGIGMWFSHLPAVPQVGDDVTLETNPDGVVLAARALATSAAPSGGNAAYGVVRTTLSGKPLWRADGCMDAAYDTASVPEAMGKLIDRAFAAWTDATATCGGLSFTSSRVTGLPAARDGISTVHVRSDRWCRPATATEPELCYAPEASAVTRVVFVDDPTTDDDGKILEFDMELNAVTFAFALPGAPAPQTTKPVLDFLSVATHEAGHAIGLAHDCGTGTEPWPTDRDGNMVPSCKTTDPLVTQATMFYRIDPGETFARAIDRNDITAACTIASQLTCERMDEGGCSEGGGGVAGSILSLLTLAKSLKQRGRRHR